MKYFKYTVILFVGAVALTIINTSATQKYHYANIKIPSFKGSWISPDHIKGTSSYQYVQKTGCVDDLTADGRVIIAKTYKKTGGGTPSSSWIEVPYSDATWGSQNALAGHTYALWLQSNKSLPTTASFAGSWTVDK